MSPSDNLKSFTPVVGRAKSKRWVQASNPSYDGYDWADGYEDDEDYISEEEIPETPRIEDLYPESVARDVPLVAEQEPKQEIVNSYTQELPHFDVNQEPQEKQSLYGNTQDDSSFANEIDLELRNRIKNINANHDDESISVASSNLYLPTTDLTELSPEISQVAEFDDDKTIKLNPVPRLSPQTTSSSGPVVQAYEEFVDDYYNYDTDTEDHAGEPGSRQHVSANDSSENSLTHDKNISNAGLKQEIYKPLDTKPVYSAPSPIADATHQTSITISDDNVETNTNNYDDNIVDIDTGSSLSTTRNSSANGSYDEPHLDKDDYSDAKGTDFNIANDLYRFQKFDNEPVNPLPKISITSDLHNPESHSSSVYNNYGRSPYGMPSASMDSIPSYSAASDSSASLSTGRRSTDSSTFSHRGSFDQQSFTNLRFDSVLSANIDNEPVTMSRSPKYYSGDGYGDLDDDEEQENTIAKTMASVKNAIPFETITKTNAPPRVGRWKPLPDSVISNLKRDDVVHNSSSSDSASNLTPIAENSEKLSDEILGSIGAMNLGNDTNRETGKNETQQLENDIHANPDASDIHEGRHEGVHDSGLNELYVNSRKFLERPISQYDYEAAGGAQVLPLAPRKSSDCSETTLNRELKDYSESSALSDTHTITSAELHSQSREDHGENNEDNKKFEEYAESRFNNDVRPTLSVVSSIASTTSNAESLKPIDRQISAVTTDEHATVKPTPIISNMLKPTLSPMFDFKGALSKPKSVQKTLFDDARSKEIEFVSGLDSWLAITYDGFINHKDSNGAVIRSVSTNGDIVVEKPVQISSGSISSAGSMVSAGTTNLANGVRHGLSSLKHTKSVLNSDVVGKVGEKSTHMIGLVGENTTKRAKGFFAKSKKLIRSSGKE